MHGHLALVLHAHLPFVRHPDRERFFEESWLFEALTGCYLPLLRLLSSWEDEQLDARITITLSPTLCEMLDDPLLQFRMLERLKALTQLAGREIERTIFEPQVHALAWMYHQRFSEQLGFFERIGGKLLPLFRGLQERGRMEIITTAATHAILPLLRNHPESLRAQLRTACESHHRHFAVQPSGVWLPECAYHPEIEPFLIESGLRWFILDSHGLGQATPAPLRGIHAPIITPQGLAVFGRDPSSANQVWSRESGYPGDPRYRDFYRDAGYDLEYDHVAPCFPHPLERGFTGIKYHAISERGREKRIYRRQEAMHAAHVHASHFLECRLGSLQAGTIEGLSPPVLLCPYDAELFGHWWFEGPEFLDALVHLVSGRPGELQMTTPGEYLERHPTHEVASPACSSWGEAGHLKVWINEKNCWIRPHLRAAQERMKQLATSHETATQLETRALNQAGRELLLAQSSDWPFMLRNEPSSHYARQRFSGHIHHFLALHQQLLDSRIDEARLKLLELTNNPFPDLDYRWWSATFQTHRPG